MPQHPTDDSRHITLAAQSLIAGYGSGRHRRTVISDACIELCRGDFAIMVGANGAGKSTLLRTLAGIQPRLGGTLAIDGTDPADMSAGELARHVAIVFTERGGGGGLTVREFVSLGRQPHTGFFGRLSPQDRRIITDAISLVGIPHLADKFLAQISDGERQKAMIARAVAQDTPIVMLDEPTSFLDAASRIETIGTLAKMAHETGRTILLSTHDIRHALALADTVIVVDKTGATARAYPNRCPELQAAMQTIFADRGIAFDPAIGDFCIGKI